MITVPSPVSIGIDKRAFTVAAINALGVAIAELFDVGAGAGLGGQYYAILRKTQKFGKYFHLFSFNSRGLNPLPLGGIRFKP